VTLELFLIVLPPITSLTSACTTLGADEGVPDAWLRAGAEESIKTAPIARKKSPRTQMRGLARSGLIAIEAFDTSLCMSIRFDPI